jgi:2-keto-4-pentenoate hydratase/2-oxohepta-3-ene-1,7-dioic acid hydratase in catechol pathway
MKLATVLVNGEPQLAYFGGDGQHLLLLNAAAREMGNSDMVFPASLIEGIQLGDVFIETVQEIVDWSITSQAEGIYVPSDEVTFQAPIPRPAKNIFCVGKNYAEHAIELGSEADIPEHIMLFSKAPTTVIGHKEQIPSHSELTKELDYEGELAVVIGKRGKGIKKDEALDFVFGYTIVNDVTARDMQSKHKQFLLGKSLDGSCPMGPFIVHKSLVENPNHLDIETRVNGEIRQKSNTDQFIFPIEEIIEVISKGMTLEPGDIIATGTPAGVGKGFKPAKYLKQGDSIHITIEGLGTLSNIIG